jgi:hypothetical protein
LKTSIRQKITTPYILERSPPVTRQIHFKRWNGDSWVEVHIC